MGRGLEDGWMVGWKERREGGRKERKKEKRARGTRMLADVLVVPS